VPAPKPTTTPPAVTNQARQTFVYAQASGVSANENSLDVYPNVDGTKKPVVIFVHGGGLGGGGDKANGMDIKPDAFRAKGYVFVSANYRLTTETRVSFPGNAQDVARAVAWVRDHIAEHGGDPSKIFLMGHSSGAYLTSLVGSDPKYLQEQGLSNRDILGVINLDSAYYVINQSNGNKDTYLRAFGPPSVWPQASPQTYVQPGAHIPPMMIASAGRTQSRVSEQHDFYESLVALTGPSKQSIFVRSPEQDHESINKKFGKSGDPITEAAFNFLKPLSGRSIGYLTSGS